MFVFISNIVNIDRYAWHKQKIFRILKNFKKRRVLKPESCSVNEWSLSLRCNWALSNLLCTLSGFRLHVTVFWNFLFFLNQFLFSNNILFIIFRLNRCWTNFLSLRGKWVLLSFSKPSILLSVAMLKDVIDWQ